MSEIHERISHLSSEKRALLEAMLARERKTREVKTISRRRNSQAPLSYAQQRMWFLDQMDPGNSAYNVPAAMRLSGKLDLQALLRSLEEIVRRHESLRTIFSIVDGQAVQIIREPEARTLSLIALSNLDDGRPEHEALRLAKQDAARPFELTSVPIMLKRMIW